VSLDRRAALLKSYLDCIPAAAAQPMAASRGAAPGVLLYKVMGKMFAILSVRGDPFVIVKSDPHIIDMLRAQYRGVGHRSHLDRRFWIAIALNADVPVKEIKRRIMHSYELVSSKLTRKQKAELAAMTS
jgi:predicted DNA-binding protein (MmcQ/YjbR family)